jgi:very-short-patch-repair endonuclease
MNKTKNEALTKTSKTLRKCMTKEERHLWYDFLKKLQLTVHRQKVIGPYIVDFYCASAKLIIELDGSQHYEVENREADALRDAYLKEQGMMVVRYSNLDIHRHFDAVCQDILKKLSLI